MCINIIKQKTIEEIIAENSALMTDAQKAQYWYEISQTTFALLGKVEVSMYDISRDDWTKTAIKQYPTLIDIEIADDQFFTTDLEGIQKILTKDWSNLVPYTTFGDCDDFATRLYCHLCDYYRINAIVPVWGNTSKGYHAFNLAVLKASNGELLARLIEPQLDEIFINEGPLGKYTPELIAEELAIFNDAHL